MKSLGARFTSSSTRKSNQQAKCIRDQETGVEVGKLENRPDLNREQKYLHAGRMVKANASEQGLSQAFEQGDEMLGP